MRYAILVIILMLTVQGCGYKGPLYLPENAPANNAQSQKAGDDAARSAAQETKSQDTK